jgi:hypothetical protein
MLLVNSISQAFFDKYDRLPSLWELAFIEHSSNYLAKTFEKKHPPITVIFDERELPCYKIAFKHTIRHLSCKIISDKVMVVARRGFKFKEIYRVRSL